MPKAEKRIHCHAAAILRTLDETTNVQTIGELAHKYGLTLRALRFYETKGLLHPQRIKRVRLYDAAQENRLIMILKGKRLGFTLTEISEMVISEVCDKLPLDKQTIHSQIAYLEQCRIDIDHAIAELSKSVG